MKFLNKFLFIAVVSVGLFSCGDSGINDELAACQAKGDSLTILQSKAFFDKSIETQDDKSLLPKYGPYTLGDGDLPGEHNITVFRENSVAKLSVILKEAASVRKVQTFNLSTNTAKITFNSDGSQFYVEPIGPKKVVNKNDWKTIGFSSSFDMKITPNCPLIDPAGLAIVGVEDARDAVVANKGDHNIVPLLASSSQYLLVYMENETSLTLSSNRVVSSWKVALDKDYCFGTPSVSTSGVNYWGQYFDKSCN